MLVLFESSAGYALFNIKGNSSDIESISKEFNNVSQIQDLVQLTSFSKFSNTADALSGITSIQDGKLPKNLKNFLISEMDLLNKDHLLVADPKLANSISKKLNIEVISDNNTQEIYRGLRSQIQDLLTDMPEGSISTMSLGLSHSLSRHKLKFSTDKIDVMIIQAIALLDDLDKEINVYSMRCKEWYGWHFPEMNKIIVDNMAFAKCVSLMGMRSNCTKCDFSEILPEELEKELKEAAEISMGTEISEEDRLNIGALCNQIVSLTVYRAELFEYLKNRMIAIAPNLTALVGEVVGARLISKAGSLINLAKQPASTVQILGAEKALFRALKAKQNTPKYGLVYHASIISQASPKYKAKVARWLSNKVSLSLRVDALGEDPNGDMGTQQRIALEERIKFVESKDADNKPHQAPRQISRFNSNFNNKTYDKSNDMKFSQKRRFDEGPSSAYKKSKTEGYSNNSDNKKKY